MYDYSARNSFLIQHLPVKGGNMSKKKMEQLTWSNIIIAFILNMDYTSKVSVYLIMIFPESHFRIFYESFQDFFS